MHLPDHPGSANYRAMHVSSAPGDGIRLSACGRRELPDAQFEMNQNTEPSELLKLATDEIAKFLKDPEHLESLQFLVNAEAYISMAMKKAGAARRSAGGY
ncbi:MAG TPA: hypothetical protein VKS22_04275 [Candidatus Binataceae bacterium]|nr:hypothetical protein [Candidatus Binataceae bacterium]